MRHRTPVPGAPPCSEPLSTTEVRVLRAVVGLHDGRNGQALPDLVAATGLPKGTLYDALVNLRDAGWITWEPRRPGTIRPLARRVA